MTREEYEKLSVNETRESREGGIEFVCECEKNQDVFNMSELVVKVKKLEGKAGKRRDIRLYLVVSSRAVMSLISALQVDIL